MKVINFTHNDLDGVACGILTKLVFDEPDIEYCNYNNINYKVSNLILTEEHKHYDKIIVTDISVSEEVANLLDNISDKVILLDHHKTALWLNERPWAFVSSDSKESGTSLYYDFLKFNLNKTFKGFIPIFVNEVRLYDTWEWRKLGNDIPYYLNILLQEFGINKFNNYILNLLKTDWTSKDIDILTNNELLDDLSVTIIENYKIKLNNYIKIKNAQLIKTKILNYKAGVVFAENHISELGEELMKLNADIDFVAIIQLPNTISYRTNKDIDVSEIAKFFGGGGHTKASGSPIQNYQINNILDVLFKEGCIR